MEEERTETPYKFLEVSNVSQCSKEGNAYLAILKETDGKRMLPVLMERQDALLLLLKMKKVFITATPLDFSDIMLGVFNNFSIRLREVRICACEAVLLIVISIVNNMVNGRLYLIVVLRTVWFWRLLLNVRLLFMKSCWNYSICAKWLMEPIRCRLTP